MTDQEIEKEIQAKGLTAAPRVTPDDVESNIDRELYFTAADGIRGANEQDCEQGDPLTLLTFCVLVLKNGFTVTGENACVSPENHDPELGRKLARKKAIDKVWELMGYELKERLAAKPNKVTIRTEKPTDVVDHLEGFSNQPEADTVAKEMIRELVGFGTIVEFKDEKGAVIGTVKLKLTPEGETWEWEGDKDKAVLILMREYLSKRRVL